MSAVCTDSSKEWTLLAGVDGVIWQWSHRLSALSCSHWHWISRDGTRPTAIHVASFLPMENFNMEQVGMNGSAFRHGKPGDFDEHEEDWHRGPSKSGKQSQRKPFTASTQVPRNEDWTLTGFLLHWTFFLPLFKQDSRLQSTISVLHVSPVIPGWQRHLPARHCPNTHVRLLHLPLSKKTAIRINRSFVF